MRNLRELQIFLVFTVLCVSGCAPGSTLNDLVALGSQVSEDKTLLESLVKDLKASSQGSDTASVGMTKSAGTSSIAIGDKSLEHLETLYSDAIAAQRSLLVVLDIGAAQADTKDVEDAAQAYERAANRFQAEAIPEVSARYQQTKGVGLDVPKSVPTKLDRTALAHLFHSNSRVRSKVMKFVSEDRLLAPWSDL